MEIWLGIILLWRNRGMDAFEKRPTMLPPAANQPCDKELRNSCVDWDAILAGAPIDAESLRTQANLVLLRLQASEYDATAAKLEGNPIEEDVTHSEESTLPTVRPLREAC